MPMRPLLAQSRQDLDKLSTSKILKLYRRFGSWSFVGRRGRDRDEGGTDSTDKVLKPTCYIRSVISQVNRTDTGQYLGHFAVISFRSRGITFDFFSISRL